MYENDIPYTELWMFVKIYFDLSRITIKFQLMWLEALCAVIYLIIKL